MDKELNNLFWKLFFPLKEKTKKFWKWIIGGLITTASATILMGILPPEDTTYRIQLVEAFSTKELYLETLVKHPDYFIGTEIIKDAETDFRILRTKEYAASSTIQAVEQGKKEFNSVEYIGASLSAKTLIFNYVKKFEYGEMYDREAVTNYQTIGEKITSLFFSYALAVYPTEDFEGATTGDINTQNTGSGWSEAWGATTACGGQFDVVTTPVLEALQAMGNADLDTGQVCRRNFSSQTTDDAVFQFVLRSQQTSTVNDWAPQIFVRTGINDGAMVLNCYENGNTVVYDNTTLTDLATCSANTNYTVELTLKPSTEQFRVKFNGTDFPSSSTYYNLQGYTTKDYTVGLDNVFFGSDFGATTPGGFADDFRDITPVATSPPADLNDDAWFQVIFNKLFRRVYAKN